MNHLYGEIVPGKRVGLYELGSSLEKITKQLCVPYIEKDAIDTIILETTGMSFFFDKRGEKPLIQITLFEGYKGSMFERIRIGSILSEFKDELNYTLVEEDNDCAFYSKTYSGLLLYCSGWDDDYTPIKFISINQLSFGE